MACRWPTTTYHLRDGWLVGLSPSPFPAPKAAATAGRDPASQVVSCRPAAQCHFARSSRRTRTSKASLMARHETISPPFPDATSLGRASRLVFRPRLRPLTFLLQKPVPQRPHKDAARAKALQFLTRWQCTGLSCFLDMASRMREQGGHGLRMVTGFVCRPTCGQAGFAPH